MRHSTARVDKFIYDRACARVNFADILQRATVIEDQTQKDLSVLTARAARRALQPDRLAELLDTDTRDIGQLQIDGTDVGKIKAAFRACLERAWAMGLAQAMDEAAKAKSFAYTESARRVRFASLRDTASEYFDANSFRMAGNVTDAMRAIIQQELLQAVKTGTRPEDVAASIYERLINRGLTTLDAVRQQEPNDNVILQLEDALGEALGTENIPAYLNTLVRTNTFEALNEARYAEFTDPSLGDFVEALRYSAILDDRTTEICAELHDSVYAVDSDVWETYRPPNHYNCRSVLIAITALDKWDQVESDPPTVEPQVGFK